MRIRIAWDHGEVFARLDDTPGSRAMLAALPLQSTAASRGEELVLSVPLRVRAGGKTRDDLEPGTVCYWPAGASLALPFGSSAIHHDSGCQVLGRLEDDPRLLRQVRSGHLLTVTRA